MKLILEEQEEVIKLKLVNNNIIIKLYSLTK